MRSFRKLLFVTFFAICVTYNYASDFYLDNSISTQVEGMFRYGNVETSLNVGRLNFAAPIYNLCDPDFNLDISLSYNSDGFKPFKASGYVGYNWCLQAGGCITREVKGYADETFRLINPNGNTSSSNSYAEGMYHYLFMNSTPQNIIDVDKLPDIWHFNFLGYRGTFMVNNQGKVTIISGDYVDVDLTKTIDNSSVTPQNSGTQPYPPNDTSQITIRTKDGYTYIFGGKLSALEYTYALADGDNETAQFPPVISSWHLSQVIAPNGRTMTYYYRGYDDERWTAKNDKYLQVFNVYYSFFHFRNWHEEKQWANPNAAIIAGTPQFNNNVKYCYTKECVLDSICVSGNFPLRIQFINSLKSRKSIYGAFTKCHSNYMLDTIKVFSQDRLIQSAYLTYRRITNANQGFYWYFLEKTAISGKGEYTFAYDTDLYNIPALLPETNSGYYQLVDIYDYWKTYPKKGTLREVHFPTGGYQRYWYGSHDYGIERRWRENVQHNVIVALLTKDVGSVTSSGIRIERIETFDSNNSLIEKKEYSYRRPGVNSTSSGVYYNNLLVEKDENRNYWVVGSTANYSFLDSHIIYSYVDERVKDGNNVDLYRNTYSFDIGTDYYCNSIEQNKYSLFSGIITFNSNVQIKGKLLCQDYYNGPNLVKSILCTYNDARDSMTELIPMEVTTLGCTDTIVVSTSYGGSNSTRYLYIYPDVMTQEVTNDYMAGNNNPLTTTKKYFYDRQLRIIKETIEDSRDVAHFTKYTYPDDFIFSTWDVFFDPPAVYQLQKKHRINTPVEQVSGYMENGEEYITSGTANLYRNIWVIEDLSNNAAYLPIRPNRDSIPSHVLDSTLHSLKVVDYYPYLYKTLSLALTEPIPVSNYQWMSVNGKSVLYDPRYKLDCEYQFDIMDRITSIKPFGSFETKYTWNGIYPATKTIGNLTWTYTHIPHVGVNSITDPRGIVTFYDYDTAGRLIKEYQIVNNKEQILKAYLYHIKTE